MKMSEEGCAIVCLITIGCAFLFYSIFFGFTSKVETLVDLNSTSLFNLTNLSSI